MSQFACGTSHLIAVLKTRLARAMSKKLCPYLQVHLKGESITFMAQAAPLHPLEAEAPAVGADVDFGEIQPAPLAPLPAAPGRAAAHTHAASTPGEAAAEPSTSMSGRFEPTPEEDLATGAYPTICSQVNSNFNYTKHRR